MHALADESLVGKTPWQQATIWRAREAWWREGQHPDPALASRAIARCRREAERLERRGKEPSDG